MNNFQEKLKSLWPHLVWMLAGLVLLINPAHIDQIASNHPKWSGVILALWAAVLAWALKIRPKPTVPTQAPMTGAGSNPVAQQQGSQSSRFTGGIK